MYIYTCRLPPYIRTHHLYTHTHSHIPQHIHINSYVCCKKNYLQAKTKQVTVNENGNNSSTTTINIIIIGTSTKRKLLRPKSVPNGAVTIDRLKNRSQLVSDLLQRENRFLFFSTFDFIDKKSPSD